MKKQIFALVLIVSTIGMSNAYGQLKATQGFAPIPLTCPTNDPLNPIPGRPYTYEAVIAPAAGTAYWYATKATTFMTAGTRVAGIEILADGGAIATGATNYMNLATAPTSPTSTTITWTSAGLAGLDATHPLFMVVEYNGPTCANNMKVMKIVPKNGFTVDITNMRSSLGTTLAYGTGHDTCYANVASASYDAAADKIQIDYGINKIYYEVVAANFTGSFTPTFQLTGITGTQTVDINWGVVKGTYSQNLGTGLASAPTITTSPITVATDATSTANGVSIFVEVTIHNNGFEGTTDQNVALAVEAVDANGNKDVEPQTCTVPATGYEDIAQQTLKARPAVTPGTPMLTQIP